MYIIIFIIYDIIIYKLRDFDVVKHHMVYMMYNKYNKYIVWIEF